MTPYDQAPGASPQSSEPDADLSALKRSGSQKRQRTKKLQIVLAPQQYDDVKTRAAAAGMSASDWGYSIIFGSPGPRARRRPTVEARALALATAALNQIGNNLNQIAHVLNAGGAFSLAGPYSAALADVRRTLHVIREAAAGRAADCDDNQGQPAR
jgi:hypothetical protein